MYSSAMYRIRIRTNKRVDEFGPEDAAMVGVRLKNGRLRYLPWRGFTLTVKHPVKLRIEAYTLEPGWNPRAPQSRIPRWMTLGEDEFLLGSYADGVVMTALPFTILTETGHGRAGEHDVPGRGRS